MEPGADPISELVEESLELRRAVRDLVALTALPAMWIGQTFERIAESLADALFASLRPNFVYLRLQSSSPDHGVELALTSSWRDKGPRAREVGTALAPWLKTPTVSAPSSVSDPTATGSVQLLVTPVGITDTYGVIAVGSSRSDFPAERDRVMLRVAANQVAVALQSVRLREARDELAQQRRIEEVLRRSEERFRALIDHSSDIITLHERDRTMTYVSPATGRLLGYSPDDLLGRSVSSLIHPDDRARARQIWDQVEAQPGSVKTDRYRLRHSNGSWRWMEVTITNLLEEPAVGAVVVNRRDVTKEVEAQQLLEQRVAERTRDLESLYRADETLYRSLRLEDVLQALVDVTADVLGADKAAVLSRDAPGASLVVRVGRGLDASRTAQLTLAPDDEIGRDVFSSAEPIAISDIAADRRRSHWMATLLDLAGVRALMSVPIVIGGELFAIFGAFYTSPHEFTDDERRLLVALAQRAGLAIENAQLYEEARGKAALEERQRLARELHDSVSQVLYAIALNASAAAEILPGNPADGGTLIDDILQLAEAGLADMRALIFELRPESLEQEGLVAALEKQAAAVRARYGIDIDFQCALGDEPDVPLAIKEALYRIAQEALHNSAKHSRARNGYLALEMVAGELVLRVGDDGKGFDPDAAFPGHLGLRSMHERAAGIGGMLEIKSAPGRGTALSVRVPLGLAEIPGDGQTVGQQPHADGERV